MTIEERVKLYKDTFTSCKAEGAVAEILLKGYAGATPLTRLELLRELDTKLAELYKVWLPVVTCWVRDNNYVTGTKEIYLGEPDLEGFLHQFRHHLQNEAREQDKKLLLVEEDDSIDHKILFRDTIHTMWGEDDCLAWSKMIIENLTDKGLIH